MSAKLFSVFLLASAGLLAGCASHEAPVTGEGGAFTLASVSFPAGGQIPPGYTCDGVNISPELSWRNVPPEARSLALVLRDPDAPSGHFLHWAVLDIPPSAAGFAAGTRPKAPARELANDAGTSGYTGPCPPSGSHRYVFTLYALDAAGIVPDGFTIEDSLSRHTLAKAVLTGTYQRTK